MGESRGVYSVLVRKPEGKRPLTDPGVDGRIILRWNFRTLAVWAWTRFIWLSIRAGDGHL